jgi:DNA mismatch repair protein MutL
MVDVNVHPAKREIRFRHEHLIFTAVVRTVKQALGQAPIPIISLPPGHSAAEGQTYGETVLSTTTPPAILGATSHLTGHMNEPGGIELQPATLRVLGQIDNTYIVAEGPGGLYLVDQHAAHERVIFERVRERSARNQMEVQGLLQPMVLELTDEEQEVFQARRADLSNLGFVMEPFGERSYLIRSIPAILTDSNITQVVRDILAKGPRRREEHDWLIRAITSMACHGAIKAGQPLHNQEAEELLQQLEQTSLPRNCPHGRPTMVHLSSGQLQRHFGRA